MHAIIHTDPTDPTALHWATTAMPTPQEGEALVELHYAGLNRADTLQAAGHYPPPPGETNILGLEASGIILDPRGATRPDGTAWQAGDAAGVLLTGGGYAQYAAVPHGQLLPIPDGFDLSQTASIIEVACTVWSNIMLTAHVKPGDLVLFHGGGGGVGIFGIQLAAALGARVAATAGSQNKLNVCRRYGADILINYQEEDFVEILRAEGGANIILDIIGAQYLDKNISALAPDGHLVIIGMQGGTKGQLNIAKLLAKRGSISATGLRYRSTADKARIVADTVHHVWPMLSEEKITHHIDRVMPIEKAAEAHTALLRGDITGKVVFQIPQG